jgi:hypothetical protein
MAKPISKGGYPQLLEVKDGGKLATIWYSEVWASETSEKDLT